MRSTPALLATEFSSPSPRDHTNPVALEKGEIGVAGGEGVSLWLWYQLSVAKGCLKRPSLEGESEGESR